MIAILIAILGGLVAQMSVPMLILFIVYAAFAAFTRRFLDYVADPASLPARERSNLLAKYRVTTGAVALSRG